MSDINLYLTFSSTQDPSEVKIVKISKRYASYSFRFQLNVNVFYMFPVSVLTKVALQLTFNIVSNGKMKDGKLLLEWLLVVQNWPKFGTQGYK